MKTLHSIRKQARYIECTSLLAEFENGSSIRELCEKHDLTPRDVASSLTAGKKFRRELTVDD